MKRCLPLKKPDPAEEDVTEEGEEALCLLYGVCGLLHAKTLTAFPLLPALQAFFLSLSSTTPTI